MRDPNGCKDEMNVSIQDMGFSFCTELSLEKVGIQSFHQLVEIWDGHSLSEFDKILSESRYYKPYLVIEIAIKLAYRKVSVSGKVSAHIEELIEQDALYSKVRFWKSLETVLRRLQKTYQSRCDSPDEQKYQTCYRVAVRHILKDTSFQTGDISPQNDSFEIECPKCGTITKFRFENIFSVSCRYCLAENYADQKGFSIYMVDEQETVSAENQTIGSKVKCTCHLCGKAAPENILDLNDTKLLQKLSHIRCPDCEGERFWAWVARQSENTIAFYNDRVLLRDIENKETICLSKHELSSKYIWNRIFSDYHNTVRECTGQRVRVVEEPNTVMVYGKVTYETQTLKGLGLSWRVQDGLQQAGIYTLADILTLSLTDAMRFPGIGQKGLLEIAEKVKDAGAHWDAWEEASE